MRLIDAKGVACVSVGMAMAMSLSSLVLWRSDWIVSAQSNYWLHGVSVLVGIAVSLAVLGLSCIVPEFLRAFLTRVFPPVMVIALLCLPFLDASSPDALRLFLGVAIPAAGVHLFLLSWFFLCVTQSVENGFLSILLSWALAGLVRGFLEFLDGWAMQLAVSLFFVCALWGLSLLWGKRVDDDLPMIANKLRNAKVAYVHALRSLWKCALYCGVFAFLGGIVRSLMLQMDAMTYVNYASIFGGFVSALVLATVWRFRTIRYSVNFLFRSMFPFLVMALCALPFTDMGSWVAIAVAFYAVYSFMSLSLQMLCAQTSYDYGVNPVFCLSFQMVVALCMQGLGYLLGNAVNAPFLSNAQPVAFIAIVSLAVLALVLYFTRGLSISQEEDGRIIEFLSLSRGSMELKEISGKAVGDVEHGACAVEDDRAGGAGPSPWQKGVKYADKLSMRCELIGEKFYLSRREVEIMRLVVQGFTIAAIAEELFISENTVKTHMRRLYAKLDIHKKQQLFSLVNSYVD